MSLKSSITLPVSFTLKQAIDKFYERNPQLKKEKLSFIYNAFGIKDSDKTKTLKDYFLSVGSPIITVNITQNLIGQWNKKC